MRQTITNTLKKAKRAYVVAINPAFTRFSVYVETRDGLEVLWPRDSHEKALWRTELLPGMTYSKNKNLPAFHFHLTGYGYSKTLEIAEQLKAINPKLEVLRLHVGWTPSHTL